MCSWDRIPAGRAMWKGCRLDLENRFYFLVKGKKNGGENQTEAVSVQGEGKWALSQPAYVTVISWANSLRAQPVRKASVKSFEVAKAILIPVRMLLSEPCISFYKVWCVQRMQLVFRRERLARCGLVSRRGLGALHWDVGDADVSYYDSGTWICWLPHPHPLSLVE